MSHGFTLIELLVVVTIIVVLLALLTPALDKAIYQAELAVCGANQKAVVSGVSTYAIDGRRHYPDRTGLNATTFGHKELLAEPTKGYDVRPRLLDRVPWDSLVDPLTEEIKVGPDQTEPDSMVFSGYALWFGFGFPGQAAMKRVGERVGWQDPEGRRYRFSAMVSDFDDINEPETGAPSAYGSHPDDDGILQPQVLQDVVGGVYVGGVGTWGSGRFVMSRWKNDTRHDRGPVDRNFGFTDGSVQRYLRVEWHDDDSGRYVRVPPGIYGGDAKFSHDTLVPR